MKICITASSDTEYKADSRFARSKYFCVYDDKTDKYEFVDNQGFTSNHGAGIAAAHQVIKLGADAVLTGNVGPNAYEILEDAGIKAFKSSELDIKNAVEMFKKEELTQIDNAAPKHFGMGNQNA